MFSKKIKIDCFNFKKRNNQKIKGLFYEILKKRNLYYKVVNTFSKNYQYSFSKKKSLDSRNINQLVFLV